MVHGKPRLGKGRLANMNQSFPSHVGVIGLGYVGLTVATAFGRILPTVGFDIDSDRV